MVTVVILTVSDRASSGEYNDESGPLIAQIIGSQTDWVVTHKTIVSDDLSSIVSQLRSLCDRDISLILTTGGTGFAPRDMTPEATRLVIEKDAPGIGQLMRAESMKYTKHAMLSRAIAGIKGGTLIINLPGSPKAVQENLAVVLPVLPHALQLISGDSRSDSSHRAV